jgi:hypothetical protein
MRRPRIQHSDSGGTIGGGTAGDAPRRCDAIGEGEHEHDNNVDLLLEGYTHLVEPGLTIVMAAPPSEARGDFRTP